MQKNNYAAFVFQFAEGLYFRGFHPRFLDNKRIFTTRKLEDAKRFDRENTEELENAMRYMDDLEVQYQLAICLFPKEN